MWVCREPMAGMGEACAAPNDPGCLADASLCPAGGEGKDGRDGHGAAGEGERRWWRVG